MELNRQPSDGYYAVLTKPQSEDIACDGLKRAGFDTIFPRIRFEREKVAVPLYSRYIFVHLDDDTPWYGAIWNIRGVTRLIGGISPSPLDGRWMAGLVTRLARDGGVISLGSPSDLRTFLPGHQVRILDGAFANQLGSVSWSGISALVVSLMVGSMSAKIRLPTGSVIHDPPLAVRERKTGMEFLEVV